MSVSLPNQTTKRAGRLTLCQAIQLGITPRCPIVLNISFIQSTSRIHKIAFILGLAATLNASRGSCCTVYDTPSIDRSFLSSTVELCPAKQDPASLIAEPSLEMQSSEHSNPLTALILIRQDFIEGRDLFFEKLEKQFATP
ncbi:hypothetical protein SUGI_0597010 [Cryptomeria japonica]|nr:hypothetical protein SUGI_0597010 [Cryptomeria japonica]